MEPPVTQRLPSVCIIIPVCNELESLPALRTQLEHLQVLTENVFLTHYLFVDDGSTDGTNAGLQLVAPAGSTSEIHTHPVNRGVGAAFRTGFRYASADIVCTIDADCTYTPAHLFRMMLSVHAGEADIVVASPYHPLGSVDGVQPWRLFLSTGCSKLYRIFTPLKLYTYTSIFRAYRGSVVRHAVFPSQDFLAAVEVLLSASKLGYRVAESPMVLHRRAAGVSKMRLFRTIRGHIKLLLACVGGRNGSYPAFCRPATTTPSEPAHTRLSRSWFAIQPVRSRVKPLSQLPETLSPRRRKGVVAR